MSQADEREVCGGNAMTRADGQRVRLSPGDWLGIVGLLQVVMLPMLAFLNTMTTNMAVLQNELEHVRADVQEIKEHYDPP